MRDRGTTIEIGLVNNMPDAALLPATERQFAHLLAAASGLLDVRIHLLALGDVPRSKAMLPGGWRSAIATPARVRAMGLDALIITGAEPVAAELADEPYWRALAELIDWAQVNTFSTVLSCLAAHAGVWRLDGNARDPPRWTKCSGVFKFDAIARHPLLAGLDKGLATCPIRAATASIDRTCWSAAIRCSPIAPMSAWTSLVGRRRALSSSYKAIPNMARNRWRANIAATWAASCKALTSVRPVIPANYFAREVEATARGFRRARAA